MATTTPAATSPSYLQRLWQTGQEHLARGRYMAARYDLEAAEAVAWRKRDATTLARLYLPLLETRRQIRQNATDGMIMIAPQQDIHAEQRFYHSFIRQAAGTILLTGPHAGKAAGAIRYAARRTGACLESLLLVEHGEHLRLCSPADPHHAAGLAVRVTSAADERIVPDVLTDRSVPLPPPGTYAPGDRLHAVARETLLVAWEALALKWQARHPAHPQPWDEIAWLRLALRIDPAAEPIAMRLMALAEAVGRGRTQ